MSSRSVLLTRHRRQKCSHSMRLRIAKFIHSSRQKARRLSGEKCRSWVVATEYARGEPQRSTRITRATGALRILQLFNSEMEELSNKQIGASWYYRQYQPAPRFSEFVQCYWHIRG